MTAEELQKIFFERMKKKLADVVSLKDLPTVERLEILLDELSDKDKRAIEVGKVKVIDKYIKQIAREK